MCGHCERGLVVTYDRTLDGSVVGVPFLHTGTAVRLVHNLKYRRSRAAGNLLAEAMVRRVPPGATSLVPVRRSLARKVRFGIDQASFLAEAVGRIVELPVNDVLRAPVWWSQRAGSPRSDRKPISFRSIRAVPEGAVLVDDVFTTGSTLGSAWEAMGLAHSSSLVATAAGTMKPGTEMVPSLGGDVAIQRRTKTDRSPAASTHFQPSFELPSIRRAISEVPNREEPG